MGEVAMGAEIDARARIVRAAAELLAAGGRDAASTRAVAAAAGVQPPTIYRLFGDMGGLLDAVAEHGFATYLREKRAQEPATDPVDELRRGWDLHVEFGLANPAIYRLMLEEPGRGDTFAAAEEGIAYLRAKIARVAEAGRLRVGVERAAQIFHAAGSGITLALIGTPPEARDPALSPTTREAILAAIIADPPESEAEAEGDWDRAPSRAIALKAALPEVAAGFTPGELALLTEWLDRIADRAR